MLSIYLTWSHKMQSFAFLNDLSISPDSLRPPKKRTHKPQQQPNRGGEPRILPEKTIDTPRILPLSEGELLNFLLHTSSCIFLIVLIDLILSSPVRS